MLELDRIRKSYRHGERQVEVLSGVSLQVHEREVVAVWGTPNSGRSTLLRVAAGIQAPDSGTVRFRGHHLSVGGGAIARGIAYCQPRLRTIEARAVLDELIAAQLALGVGSSAARSDAALALERAGARRCERRRLCELDRAEAVRVGIARALLQRPALLVIDEPTTGVEPIERDRILSLLRSLTEDDIAVLMSLDKGSGLFGADRALSLNEGELRGKLSPELAAVVELPLRLSG